jgi:iron(III) transport system permease protein
MLGAEGSVRRAGPALLVIATVAICVTPLYWMFSLALEDGAAGIQRALELPNTLRLTIRTAYLAVGSAVIALVLGTVLAWAAHRLPPGRRWLSALPVVPLLVPAVASVTGWAFLLSPRIGYLNALLRELPFLGHLDEGPFDVYSIAWIIVITGFNLTSFVFLFLRSSLEQLSQDLLDAAAVAGMGQTRTFLRIVVPLVSPAIMYAGATSLLLGLGQFVAPLLLGTQVRIGVLTTEMYLRTREHPAEYGLASAYGIPILLAGLALLALQRWALRDQRRYVTTQERGRRPLTAGGLTSQAFLAAYGIITTVLPLGALLVVSFSRHWTARPSLELLTVENYVTAFTSARMLGAIQNTVVYALAAAVIVIPLAYVSARVIHARRSLPLLSAAQETASGLPLGIPSVIFGVGFLLAYLHWPFTVFGVYGSPAALVLVYVTLMLPFAVRIQYLGMVSLGEELSNAAAVHGAGPLRRFASIDVPLLRPAIGSAAVVSIVLMTHEFAASLFVRSARTQVMATLLYDEWTTGSYPRAATLAILLCVLTGAGLAVATKLGTTTKVLDR